MNYQLFNLILSSYLLFRYMYMTFDFSQEGHHQMSNLKVK